MVKKLGNVPFWGQNRSVFSAPDHFGDIFGPFDEKWVHSPFFDHFVLILIKKGSMFSVFYTFFGHFLPMLMNTDTLSSF